MFDVGFWELVIIATVSLLVAGPERLPGMIRDGGKLFGKIRRFVLQTKYEVEQELRLDEQRDLQTRIDNLDKLMDIAPDKTSGDSSDQKTP
ncbi:MAG: Sec-independent protein translocase protein TatB [Gammaproteobacteria bacterium]